MSRGSSSSSNSRPWVDLDGDDSAFTELYSIGAKIGEGAFGKVFVCKDRCTLPDSSQLCVKVLPLHGRHQPRSAVKCSIEERNYLYSNLMAWRHPNIVRYYNFVLTKASLHVVMERCMGPNLSEFLTMNDDNLEVMSVRSAAQQMLSALATVHSAEIMHRDIKTENFQFFDTAATRLQLLDFGFAKHSPRLPQEHSITGSLIYAAPEVLTGVYEHSCDLWGVGVVLFQIFAGYCPFDTSDVNILRSLHKDPVLTGDSLFRGIVWKRMTKAGKELIRGLLTVDATERLSAEVALEHRWFKDSPSACEEEAKLGSFKSLTALRRNQLDLNLANLVDNCIDSDSEPEEEPLAH